MWEVDETLFRSEVFPLFKTYIEEHGASTKNIYPHFVLQPYASKKEGKAGVSVEGMEVEGASLIPDMTHWDGVQGEEGTASLLSFLGVQFSIPVPKRRRLNNTVLKKVTRDFSDVHLPSCYTLLGRAAVFMKSFKWRSRTCI
jgi:hypothetical protein